MTVLNVNIFKDNGEIGEIGKPGNVRLTNLDRGVKVFIGLTNEFVNDPVFVIEYGSSQRDEYNTYYQQKIKENLLEPGQK